MHFNFLKRSSETNYIERTLESKELFELIDVRQKSFWWRSGQYKITLIPKSPKKFELSHSLFTFDLTAIDIDQLKQNIDTLRTDIENLIKSDLPDYQALPLTWNWANVSIQKA